MIEPNAAPEPVGEAVIPDRCCQFPSQFIAGDKDYCKHKCHQRLTAPISNAATNVDQGGDGTRPVPEVCACGAVMEFLGAAAIMFPPGRRGANGDSWVCPQCGFRMVVVSTHQHEVIIKAINDSRSRF